MRSWLSRSSAAAHVTVAVSGLTQKDQLPCAAGAAVRGQANEPGDLQNRRASVRELLEASPSASGKAYKKVASYACMPRTGEAWTEAGMTHARLPIPQLWHVWGCSAAGRTPTNAQPGLQLPERVQRGTRRRSWLSPPTTLYCREWPHAAGRVAVCGRLTSRATCLSKRPRLHPPLLFGQWKLRNTSWCAGKRVCGARRRGLLNRRPIAHLVQHLPRQECCGEGSRLTQHKETGQLPLTR